MKLSAIAASLTVCLTLPVFADDIPDTQKQDLFERLKTLENESHQQRIAILQQADDCINQTQNIRQYRECEASEKKARQDFKQGHRQKKQALRQEFREFHQNRLSQR